MTTTNVYHVKHPHYAIRKKYERLCYESPDDLPIVIVSRGGAFMTVDFPAWETENQYRIASKLIKRFGVLLPAPLVQVGNGQQVWVVRIGWPRPGLCTFGVGWGSELEQGYIFATQEDAQATHDVVCAAVAK